MTAGAILRRVAAIIAVVSVACVGRRGNGADVGLVSLFDGERTGVVGASQFLNSWGGGFSPGNIVGVARDPTVARSGVASVRADLGTIASGGFGFFQTFAGEIAGSALRQTRDMTRYERFEAHVRNDTGAALNLVYEIKDYRDSNSHRAQRTFSIPAGAGWTKIEASLAGGLAGWTIDGTPDLSRTYINSFVVSPQTGAASGSIFLDDFKFHEVGPVLDSQTAPVTALAERLAERQFSGLWTARNRSTGLIYNTSDDAGAAAMNTTAGVLWMLPSAVRRGWVSQADADVAAGQIAASLQTNLNLTTYLPSRFINPAAAGLPGGDNEESSIDASFIALALHRYKTLPTTSPSLAAALDAVQNRFQFDAFVRPGGFDLAYRPTTGFTGATYNGYTNEGKVISLAAAASDDHHVPLADRWNSDTGRVRAFLVNVADAHLVHSSTMYRAPFEQALVNLFVDTSDRGVDNFPNRTLATNPWVNFVRYQRETAAKLEQLGRDGLFQPDAGLGFVGSGGYQQFSLYNDFGQPDLLMPWSVSLALLAGADGAEEALRAFMGNELLNGPLGLADSARWTTGAAGPTNVPAFQDNWNMVLSTMALLEYLDGPDSGSRFFANLPEISAQLDTVFVDGDMDGNGVADAADLAIWQTGYGKLVGGLPSQGDANGDTRIDGADFLRWQRGFSGGGAVEAAPEPGGWLLLLAGGAAACLISRCSFS
ncbi:MAG: hypothetical protein KF688_00685 [Pirellulales bacterium]|nr:hypothetical protein [Pirellulales bacterium]